MSIHLTILITIAILLFIILGALALYFYCKWKDSEAQSIKQPCNVGDTIYSIFYELGCKPRIREEVVTFIEYRRGQFLNEWFIKTTYGVQIGSQKYELWFLDEEQAKARLKKYDL